MAWNEQETAAELEAFEIARQLCEGLAEAHRRGIVHRDLKTGNVIVCRNEKKDLRAVITGEIVQTVRARDLFRIFRRERTG